MCERLVIPGRAEVEQDLSVLNPWWSFETRFNVAVTHKVPAARMHAKESEGVMMRWGLVPAETKLEPRAPIGAGVATVEAAAVSTSSALRNVWMSAQRCIVPLAGFYV
ncbi:MAG TPA: SOS response-associated peptidase family protein, partial [Steroidobacteraceae bacterium]|nr:SOS response-associated peptidase family protein [Steroidobacteraceae bacterium]